MSGPALASEVPEIIGEKVTHPWDSQRNVLPLTATNSPAATKGRKEVHHEEGYQKRSAKKDDSVLATFCAWVVDHQIGLATNLIVLHALTHICFPKARRHTRKFYELSYYNAESGGYTQGWNDIFMVVYWVVLFTGFRAAIMDFVLIPFAAWGGVQKKMERIRFAEQAWLLLYYCTFWSLGMYIFYNSDYWLNFREMWTNWPNRELQSLSKWYYLVQYAFWLQQILVVNIEKRRKDYHQMFAHHIITCALIFTSYGYCQTRVGNVILCVMDVVDISFPLAKLLKYLHYDVACDYAFGFFMITWVIARHILYMMVCWSVYKDIPAEINYGCYYGKTGEMVGPIPPPDYFGHLIQPFQDPEGLICFNDKIKWGFLAGLLALQVLMVIWFVMICKVAWKVINGGQAEDSRSDDEDAEEDAEEEEEEEGDEEEEKKKRALLHQDKPSSAFLPLEEECGVESINLKGRTSANTRRFKKATGSASGVTLPGHSDRKELLGRIGCDKGL
ncbi:MAG: sphingosine N-acyltransferase lag1 [Trizodia sp. TS-e1964]|nr:MAG: sphingosine N-acyltransferase lag1 [Trizodia sp. TS-e1964]